MEGTAIGGFGGGVGGWLGNRYGLVEIPMDGEQAILTEEYSLSKENKKDEKKSKHTGVISELNHTVLGSWKYQSEGVEDKLMLVSGWDANGKHKNIESNKLSQGKRQLWGGRKVTSGSKWFGPRDRNKEIEDLEKAKKEMQGKSYWPLIQKAGDYVTESDLKGISEKWKGRDLNLETQILELYKARKWWLDKMGRSRQGDRVDLEFNLEIIKKILDTGEDQLKARRWNYGQLANNGKLTLVRTIGNPEAVAWNYFRKYAWGKESEVKRLKEVNLVNTIVKLMTGESVGFPCVSYGRESFVADGLFDECKNTPWWGRDEIKVKSVLKSVVPSFAKGKIPTQKGRGGWKSQQDAGDNWSKIYNENFDESKVINEKCEPDNWWSLFTDQELKIRQEVCDLIIRPWFGDQVSEKRLCLIEATEYKNYLRLSTYLNVLQIPEWHNKSTFWTKCSNYGI
ncbi:hypothetical protein DNK47_01810 [Mycoplasma wenyonii]|uniref:Uncharacterized protein n=1 Tax=Mycoplasma wenyonii TaxID=65123 RepID=A0A328PJ12_9MOLU|nr:hypothetical protein DNK47_01810 [Mycoplasma wenyonii]